jgi:hypothetical protein
MLRMIWPCVRQGPRVGPEFPEPTPLQGLYVLNLVFKSGRISKKAVILLSALPTKARILCLDSL